MSKTLLLLLGVASIASASTYKNAFALQADDEFKDFSPNGLNMTEFRYFYTVARGSLEGF